MLVVVLVHMVLDYGSGVLADLASLIRQLQSILNAAARLIYHLRSCDHITDALISLHWLWIQYKLAILMYKILHGGALSIFVHSSASLIYLVDKRCVLLAPIVL